MILFHVKKSFVWRTFFYSSEFYHVTIIWYSIILIKFFAKHGRIHTWKSSWKWSHIELHLINPMRIILNSLQFFLLTNAEKMLAIIYAIVIPFKLYFLLCSHIRCCHAKEKELLHLLARQHLIWKQLLWNADFAN